MSEETMPRRTRWGLIAALLVVAGLIGLAAASAPYLPVVHGTTDDEVERLASWLGIDVGTHVADLGAGDGTFAIALARRVGATGHVYATEIDDRRLAEIRRAVTEADLSNVTVIEGAVSSTNLPAGCCDALFSRNVYHHLSDAAALNADIFRALRPGGRLLVIDFEPGGIMDLIGHPAGRHDGHGTPRAAVTEEVTGAGFELERGPATWRGRLYAVMFTRPRTSSPRSSTYRSTDSPQDGDSFPEGPVSSTAAPGLRQARTAVPSGARSRGFGSRTPATRARSSRRGDAG
jgi:predicted methyltransferase